MMSSPPPDIFGRIWARLGVLLKSVSLIHFVSECVTDGVPHPHHMALLTDCKSVTAGPRVCALLCVGAFDLRASTRHVSLKEAAAERRQRPKPLQAIKPGCKFAACHGSYLHLNGARR